jgi:bud site selection protein 31
VHVIANEMPRLRTLNTKKAPEGWDEVAPQLEEFQQQMRDQVNEPHEGKRRNEATWGITKIHYERSRYIYELYYKKKAISKELYDFLLQEKWGDANLIAKWKKPGYEYLCSLQAIDKKGTNFGTTALCRVPLHLRRPGPQGPSVNTGCISCASTEAGRLGGPIWWDTPRPADLVGWAKAGCPTEDKPAKKRKVEPEDAELDARARALRKGPGADPTEAAELEALSSRLSGRPGGDADAASRGDAGFEPPGDARSGNDSDDDMASDVTGTLEARYDPFAEEPVPEGDAKDDEKEPQATDEEPKAAAGGHATPSPGSDEEAPPAASGGGAGEEPSDGEASC